MEAIKIGWLGSALDGPGGGYDKIHRMAFDEAAERGVLDRPVEFVLHAENGLPGAPPRTLPTGSAGCVDQGCIGVAGAYSSDNGITVGAPGQRVAAFLSSAGAGQSSSRRLLLSARQWRLRRGHDADRGLAEAPRPRAGRCPQRDLPRTGKSTSGISVRSAGAGACRWPRWRPSVRHLPTWRRTCAVCNASNRTLCLHGLRNAGRPGAATGGPGRARLGSAPHHDHARSCYI